MRHRTTHRTGANACQKDQTFEILRHGRLSSIATPQPLASWDIQRTPMPEVLLLPQPYCLAMSCCVKPTGPSFSPFRLVFYLPPVSSRGECPLSTAAYASTHAKSWSCEQRVKRGLKRELSSLRTPPWRACRRVG